MTLDELNKMEPRAADAMVAERIMGFVRLAWESDPQRYFLSLPEQAENYRMVVCDVPYFSTDPAADYSVLCRVRQKWDIYDRQKFGIALDAIFQSRITYCMSAWETASMYEPGDYSRAALLAVSEQEVAE